MWKSILRPVLRGLLRLYCQLALRKHQPTIIAILGTGETSVTREVIYFVAKQQQASRRNLETPEAEFSVPLTVLAYPHYPRNYLEWLWVVLKTTIQTVSVRKYSHSLVLELNAINLHTLQFWLTVLAPQYVVINGEQPSMHLPESAKLFLVEQGNFTDILHPHYLVASEIGLELGLSESEIDLGLAEVDFPQARLRLLNGKNGSLVIDATHYYFPVNIAAVTELIPPTTQRLIVFTPAKLDTFTLQSLDYDLYFNPPTVLPQPTDTIILRGLRTQELAKHKDLIRQDVHVA